jgi:hypothetical protein
MIDVADSHAIAFILGFASGVILCWIGARS